MGQSGWSFHRASYVCWLRAGEIRYLGASRPLDSETGAADEEPPRGPERSCQEDYAAKKHDTPASEQEATQDEAAYSKTAWREAPSAPSDWRSARMRYHKAKADPGSCSTQRAPAASTACGSGFRAARRADDRVHAMPLPSSLPTETDLRKFEGRLDYLKWLPAQEQQRTIRKLLAQWHPDKHPENLAQATRAFQWLERKCHDLRQ
eukprot:TRINITY_DN12186_c0_g1_i1.p2 TRINITY_DN12186_c0_g1~~TRINITY_DN12186_c0_g1_i1.p2  ORF type:complete len:206 (+),score=33.36 TRINITY_DN12186_c0_g1_i1:92-709(+)